MSTKAERALTRLRRQARQADAELVRLARGQGALDLALGDTLLRLFDGDGLRQLACGRRNDYARERLGLPPRTMYLVLRLARETKDRPLLRRAVLCGAVSSARAVGTPPWRRTGSEEQTSPRGHAPRGEGPPRAGPVGGASPPHNEGPRGAPGGRSEPEARRSRAKAEGAKRPTAQEERRNLAHGVRRIWGPKEVMETIRLSIAMAQAVAREHEEAVSEGKALAMTGAYFLAVWAEHRKRHRRRPLRRAVIGRTDGICSAPGCTNGIEHLHHVKFRSRGGTDEVVNLVGVCATCHAAIHAGLIRVWGRADGKVVFEFRCFEREETWEWTEEGGSRRVPAAVG